ncbi:uncharacterized protein LOC134763085 [Penaeus indicus]|uniref:uncharacterized protein LOC134763085 n=1 Tax=Penaeus indicus TaxID=29960 RepID=UPI00300C06E6
MYSWKARTLLVLVLVTTATQESLGVQRSCQYGKRQTARNIVDIATRASYRIESFKDNFVQSILSMDWNTANQYLPPGHVEDECLPPPPPSPGTYSVQDFPDELVRMYSMMQNYSTALHHLTLDRVLNIIQTTDYNEDVSDVSDYLDLLMNHLRQGIICRNKSPDNQETERIMKKMYIDIGPDRHSRDFAILRDTLDALGHSIEVFETFT